MVNYLNITAAAAAAAAAVAAAVSGEAVSGNFSATTPVGSFPPNLFGLYDMHGNLWEWCLDEWTDNYNGAPTDGSARGNIISRDENKSRLLRGGSWCSDAQYCLAAYRFYDAASHRNYVIGFRVVGVQPSTPKCQSF